MSKNFAFAPLVFGIALISACATTEEDRTNVTEDALGESPKTPRVDPDPNKIEGLCYCGSDTTTRRVWSITQDAKKTWQYCIDDCCWPVVLAEDGRIPQPPDIKAPAGLACLEKSCGGSVDTGYECLLLGSKRSTKPETSSKEMP